MDCDAAVGDELESAGGHSHCATAGVKILLLHNPVAGERNQSEGGLIAMLGKAGHEVDYLGTDHRELKRRLAGPADLIVIAGGDGTVARVLAQIEGKVAPLTVLPLGTANNLARSLGIDAPVPELIAGLGDGHLVPLDFGMTAGPWGRQRFFESAGFGAIARALAPVNQAQLPSADKIPQGRHALRKVFEAVPSARLRIMLDEQQTDEDVLMLELTKIASIGPRLCLAPSAAPSDGFIDVACLATDRREAMLQWLEDPERSGPAPVTLRKAREVAVTWRGIPSHLDDFFHEAPEVPSTMRAWLEPGAVDVLVPEARSG